MRLVLLLSLTFLASVHVVGALTWIELLMMLTVSRSINGYALPCLFRHVPFGIFDDMVEIYKNHTTNSEDRILLEGIREDYLTNIKILLSGKLQLAEAVELFINVTRNSNQKMRIVAKNQVNGAWTGIYTAFQGRKDEITTAFENCFEVDDNG